MPEESIVTTIRMKPHTSHQLERMKTLVNAPSNSDMIRRSIELSEMLIDEIIKGGSIIIEDKKGKQQQIKIVGINR